MGTQADSTHRASAFLPLALESKWPSAFNYAEHPKDSAVPTKASWYLTLNKQSMGAEVIWDKRLILCLRNSLSPNPSDSCGRNPIIHFITSDRCRCRSIKREDPRNNPLATSPGQGQLLLSLSRSWPSTGWEKGFLAIFSGGGGSADRFPVGMRESGGTLACACVKCVISKCGMWQAYTIILWMEI